jgi:hypothetical protein
MNRLSKTAALGAIAFALTAQAGFAAASLAVNNGAAMNGTSNGLQVVVPSKGTTFGDSAYVNSTEPNAETHYLMRFWINPCGMTIPNDGAGGSTNYFRFLFGTDANAGAGSTPFTHLIGFIARSPGAPGNYRILFWFGNNALGYEFAGGTFLTPFSGCGPARVEVEWTKATSGANGKFKLTNLTNAAAVVDRSDLDNGNLQVDDVYIGYLYSNGNGNVSGSFAFDEFESFR